MADPDTRPTRKVKRRRPTEFCYVVQLADVRENTRRGVRGLIVPAPRKAGLAQRARPSARHRRRGEWVGLTPREVHGDTAAVAGDFRQATGLQP
jgi:hypothetical protein